MGSVAPMLVERRLNEGGDFAFGVPLEVEGVVYLSCGLAA